MADVAKGNSSALRVIPVVLGILGAMVTGISLTYGITQGIASEKVEDLKLDYESFRRTDERFKGLIIERLDTTNALIKEHMRDTR